MKSTKIDKGLLPEGYVEWRKEIESRIESAKFNAALHVNTDMLELYWSIGEDIIKKQKEFGWGGTSNRTVIKRFVTEIS